MLHLSPTSTVVVIGPPGSGKTHVGALLAESSGLPLYSTDEYLSDGHVAALYLVMKAIGDRGWIVEGMIGYRLLRKRAEYGLPPVDIVIELEATDSQITDAYRARGRKCDIAKIRSFCAAHESVLEDYFLLDAERPKVWIHADSRHICPLISDLIGGGPDGNASSDSSK